MRILVSNDDGIHATGIRTLAETLSLEHDVYVIAPDRERSAAAHALTLHKPLRVEDVEMGIGVVKSWATSGTPGDCIKIGINTILDFKPDMIISGINHGPNLGSDVLYSGTVNAAMEGAVLGIPSVAVSLSSVTCKNMDFIYTSNFVLKFLNKIKVMNFPQKSIININVPDVSAEEIAGVQVTKLGTRMYTDTYEKRVDPRGKTYYWLAGEFINDISDEATDIAAISRKKISITPVTFEMTHKSIMPEIEKVFCDGLCY